MKVRLALLFVALCLAAAAAAYVQLQVAPSVRRPGDSPAPSMRNLSAAEKAKLKDLQTRFMNERDEYLKLRNAKAPAERVQAQWQRVLKAVEAVQALGGTEAIKVLPVSKYAPIGKKGGTEAGGTAGGK